MSLGRQIGLVKNYFGSTLGHFGLVRITFGKLWVTLGHFGSTFVWVILSQIGSIWVTGLTLGQFGSIWVSCVELLVLWVDFGSFWVVWVWEQLVVWTTSLLDNWSFGQLVFWITGLSDNWSL